MVVLRVLLWLTPEVWAQDADEVDPEELLLETELAIGEQDEEPTDAVDMGILESEVEPPAPMLPWVGRMETDAERELTESTSDLPPLGDVVDRALARAGGTSSAALARDVARARFFPRLTLVGERERVSAWDSSTRTDQTRWLAELHLCFGACGTSLDIDDVDGDYAPDLLVTAGEVVELDDRGAYASSATGVLESGAEHRLAVASRLAELYARRAMFAAQRGRTRLDEVRRVLDVAEIDAQLDLYTDGWFAGGRP
jgi:hypothetical protein